MRPVIFYLVAAFIVISDQLTKWTVIRGLPLGASRPAFGEILLLTHTRNTGGAFSILPAGNSIFIGIAAVAVGAILLAYHRYQRPFVLVSGALALALGGAIGNLIDRMRFGYVVDFFDFQAGTGRTLWPIFNIADSAITVGIVLLALHFLFHKEPKPEEAAVTATPLTEDQRT